MQQSQALVFIRTCVAEHTYLMVYMWASTLNSLAPPLAPPLVGGNVGDNGGADADIALADATQHTSQQEQQEVVGHRPQEVGQGHTHLQTRG